MEGYASLHEYRFIKESETYHKVSEHYMNVHNMLIPEDKVDDPHIIPESWYRYTRSDVDTPTKKNAIKLGMSKWMSWEKETRDKLKAVYKTLIDSGEIEDAMFVECLIKDVSEELKYAERIQLDLGATDYDMTYICSKQKHLHDKYKSML